MLLGWRYDAMLAGTFVVLAALAHNGSALSGWAFLVNQTDCRLSCQNGGVCAFDRDQPHRHKCICFVGMFYGEQCEFAVSMEETNNAISSNSVEDEATANGALKAGVSAPDQDALSTLDDPDAPYADAPAGVGGSIDGAADAIIPDGNEVAAVSQNNAVMEEPSYDLDTALNELSASTTTASAASADEIEFLRDESHNRDAYSRLELDDAPVATSTATPREDEHDNVLVPPLPPDELTTPSTDWHSNEEQQQQIEQQKTEQEQQVQLELSGGLADGPADGMGSSFLTNDEFHAAPNVKRYEEHPRTTQSHYASSAPIDTAAPSTSTPAERREKTRRKHHRVRTTTTPAPSDSDADEDDDDGWMISAKGRRRVSAPSAAVGLHLGLAVIWTAVVVMTFCQVSRHILF